MSKGHLYSSHSIKYLKQNLVKTFSNLPKELSVKQIKVLKSNCASTPQPPGGAPLHSTLDTILWYSHWSFSLVIISMLNIQVSGCGFHTIFLLQVNTPFLLVSYVYLMKIAKKKWVYWIYFWEKAEKRQKSWKFLEIK